MKIINKILKWIKNGFGRYEHYYGIDYGKQNEVYGLLVRYDKRNGSMKVIKEYTTQSH